MNKFTRSHITFFGYFIISFFAFNQMGLGPVSPYISGELGINKAQSGLYVTMFASGMMISGFITTFLQQYLSRKKWFFIGFIGLIVCLASFLAIQTYIASLISILLLGSLSTVLLTNGQAILSDYHGPRRDTALLEANISAAVIATICPLLLGLVVKSGLNWRIGLIGPIALASFIFLYYMFCLYKDPGHHDEAPHKTADPKTDKPHSYLIYFYWVVCFIGVSCEWGTMFWAPKYIEEVLHFAKEDASLITSILYCFFVAGRIIASRLTGRYKSESILLVFVALAVIAFPFFWIESYFAVNLAAFAVLALCVANYYPLTLSVIMGFNSADSDKASALVTIATGTALLTAPLGLGFLSDKTDLKTSYLAVAVLFALLALSSVWGWRKLKENG